MDKKPKRAVTGGRKAGASTAKPASRRVTEARKTRETDIRLMLDLDGEGKVSVATGIGFFDHMLTAMARHGLFDLELRAAGDTHVDAHHTVEDVGIVLGTALAKALGDKKGINRFGTFCVPMDEALARATVDLSDRPYLVYKVEVPERARWEFDVNLVKEFFAALSQSARLTLHLKLEYGENYHHCCEAVMKAAGRALRMAVERDPRVKDVPSTKGSLG